MATDILFEPLVFRHLTVKNRIFRSNIAGRFDNYDGSGTPVRIAWEAKFARGGVGAILSSFVPVQLNGRILPNYATIDSDARIPFWRELAREVHRYDCQYILQLSHGGRQRDLLTVESPTSYSSTGRREGLHGFPCRSMTVEQIRETVAAFAHGARRAREAGIDGVELHGANGYLITQFLSSAINDRRDEYGGSLENRARFLLEIVRAIRGRVGADFHLQVKISTTEHHNDVVWWERRGNTLADSLQVCRWLEAAGVDAIHVSTGSTFPHPRNPAGDLPMADFLRAYPALFASGSRTLMNYVLMRTPLARTIFYRQWTRPARGVIEGANLPDAAAVKRAVSIPVLCTGGFQTASVIRQAIGEGRCDAVSIARPLVANNDLVQWFARGHERAPKPCTYCNKCLVNAVINPLGCYDETRFASREAMVDEILSVFAGPHRDAPTADLHAAGQS
jgi:2,4-dienoyl-CoA reductase-like NADH-dependent reductase (Old Yellow Enzyme family)